MLYRRVIVSIEVQVIKVWVFQSHLSWWNRVIEVTWYSRLTLRAKVFILREYCGWGLAYGRCLKPRKNASKMCFFCLAKVENIACVNLFHIRRALKS